MSDTLMHPQTVYRFGRKHTQHDWSVHVVGSDAEGYHVQVRTRCGLIIAGNADANLVMGFVTCAECEVAP